MSDLDKVSEMIGSLNKGQEILLKRTENMQVELKKINGHIIDHTNRIYELERHRWTGKKALTTVVGLSVIISTMVAIVSLVV